MSKIYFISLIFILFACGGGSSTASTDQPAQPAAITFKKVPESLSMIE